MEKNKISPLVPLGIGIAIGGSALWLLIELWPILLVGGGIALALGGMTNTSKESE